MAYIEHTGAAPYGAYLFKDARILHGEFPACKRYQSCVERAMF